MLGGIKNNFAVVVGISLPILLILFLVGSIYLPSMFLKPQYDFIYALCARSTLDRYYNCQDYKIGVEYDVVGERIVKREIERGFDEYKYQTTKEGSADVRLFMHDVDTNASREISLEEAEELKMDDGTVSPDGFVLDQSRRRGGTVFFPFFYDDRSYSSYVLRKGDREKEVNLVADSGDYYYWYGNSFEFVGWVID